MNIQAMGSHDELNENVLLEITGDLNESKTA